MSYREWGGGREWGVSQTQQKQCGAHLSGFCSTVGILRLCTAQAGRVHLNRNLMNCNEQYFFYGSGHHFLLVLLGPETFQEKQHHNKVKCLQIYSICIYFPVICCLSALRDVVFHRWWCHVWKTPLSYAAPSGTALFWHPWLCERFIYSLNKKGKISHFIFFCLRGVIRIQTCVPVASRCFVSRPVKVDKCLIQFWHSQASAPLIFVK